MFALMLSLTALVAQQAPADDDPEPPKPGPIGVRLVAKKAKYKLDFGGEKMEEYVRLAKAGQIAPPAVDLELELTNQTKEVIRIRSSGLTHPLRLTLKGDGVIVGRSKKVTVNIGDQYSTLEPGEKLKIRIDRLVNRGNIKRQIPVNDDYLYWTEPGKYTLTASFYTVVLRDFAGKATRTEQHTLTSKPITVEVEK